jgi:hypothetical protein
MVIFLVHKEYHQIQRKLLQLKMLLYRKMLGKYVVFSDRDLLAYVLILLSCVNKAAKPTGLASTIKTVSLFGSKYAIIRCAVSSLSNHAEIAEHYVHYISEARHSYLSTSLTSNASWSK